MYDVILASTEFFLSLLNRFNTLKKASPPMKQRLFHEKVLVEKQNMFLHKSVVIVI